MIGEPYMIKIAFFDIDGTLLKMGCKEPTDKTVKALNSLRQNGILLCMATGRGYLSIPKFKDITFIVTNGTDEHLEEYFKFGNETLTIADNFDELCKEDIYQIMCACRKEEYAQILQGTENTQITAWWDKAADIIPLNCGKGNAVNAVLNYYGLSKDEAIAFGDGRNDIEMLEAVGTGVAMGNAIDEVKARADVICKSVEEDGVYHYCLEKKLIKC